MKKAISTFALWVAIIMIAGCAPRFVSVFPEEKPAPQAKPGEFAPQKTADGIKFTYKTRRKKIDKVNFVGTMNNWNQETDAMTQVSDGTWEITKKLEPGYYEYKFLIDGSMWVSDSDNPSRTQDGWNNSIILVTKDGDLKFPIGEISQNNPGFYYHNYQAVTSADWIKSAVLYELFPRVFSDKGFNGVTAKLDYLKELGVNTLWIMPLHPIGKVNRKGTLGSPYSVKDYFDVNPEFGTKEDFKRLVDEAHKRGMRVILDWVANHSAFDNEQAKKHPDWYIKDEKGEITFPKGTDWTDVADLNYDSKELRKYMISALKYWVENFGVDGYRFDVAGMVPIDFWEDVRAELQKIKPDIFMLAESEDAIHNAKAFDLTYEGGLRETMRLMAKSDKTQYDFYKAYIRMKYSFPKDSLRMHWLENHDQEHALKLFGKDAIYPAAVVLMTIDGVPLVLMGQEFGDRQWKNWRSLFDAQGLDWDTSDTKLFEHYAQLIALRNSHPVLSTGEMILMENNQPKAISYVRRNAEETILVVANLSGKELNVLLSPAELKKLGLTGKITSKSLLEKDASEVSTDLSRGLIVPAWQSLILSLKK